MCLTLRLHAEGHTLYANCPICTDQYGDYCRYNSGPCGCDEEDCIDQGYYTGVRVRYS